MMYPFGISQILALPQKGSFKVNRMFSLHPDKLRGVPLGGRYS
jgi:hypothetical protein